MVDYVHVENTTLGDDLIMDLKDFITYKSAQLRFIYDDERYHDICHLTRSKSDRKTSDCIRCLKPREMRGTETFVEESKPKRFLVKSRLDLEDWIETTCDGRDARVTKRDIIMIRKTVVYEGKETRNEIKNLRYHFQIDANKSQDNVSYRIEKNRTRRCKCKGSQIEADKEGKSRIEKTVRRKEKISNNLAQPATGTEREYKSKIIKTQLIRSALSRNACVISRRPFRFSIKSRLCKLNEKKSTNKKTNESKNCSCSRILSGCLKELDVLNDQKKPTDKSFSSAISSTNPSEVNDIVVEEFDPEEHELHEKIKFLCKQIIHISKSCHK